MAKLPTKLKSDKSEDQATEEVLQTSAKKEESKPAPPAKSAPKGIGGRYYVNEHGIRVKVE